MFDVISEHDFVVYNDNTGGAKRTKTGPTITGGKHTVEGNWLI